MTKRPTWMLSGLDQATNGTLDPNWVRPDPDAVCERCLGKENVFSLKLIYDVGTYLCRDCIEEAAAVAFGRAWMTR